MTGVEVVELRTSPAQQGSYTIPCSPLLRRSYFETVVAEMFLVAMNSLRQRSPPFTTGPLRHEFLHCLGVKPLFTRLGIGRYVRHFCFEFNGLQATIAGHFLVLCYWAIFQPRMARFANEAPRVKGIRFTLGRSAVRSPSAPASPIRTTTAPRAGSMP